MKSGMEEALENRIYIADFTNEVIKLAIECHIRDQVTDRNAYEFLHFANKYDVHGFKISYTHVLIVT
uniref:Uncharacterized protein n=1 Tax=Panagrolaimus sp. PS1159 TaxID=55785 RepID=A0AC35F7L3_9BILA